MFSLLTSLTNSSVKRSFNSANLPFLPYWMIRPGASKRTSGAVPASIAVVIFSGPDLKSMVSNFTFTSGFAFSNASMIDFSYVPTPSPVFS